MRRMCSARSILTYFALVPILAFFYSCKDDDESPKPIIASVSPPKARVGVTITISGQNFSATGANTVTISGTPATISSSSGTSITTTVPPGATTGPLVVTTDGKSSAPFNFEVLADPPEIENFSPTSGKAGTEVVITGKNFSVTASANTVTVNGAQAEVKQATATSITIIIPADASSGKLTIALNDETVTSAQDFVVVPEIASISPGGGAVNAVVTINGTGLGQDAGLTTVSFNGTQGEVISNDGVVIMAKVPEGAATGQVTVTVGGITSNGLDFRVGKEIIHAGGANYDKGYAVEVDQLGNMYVAGSFSVHADFENTILTGTLEDGFVAKYNPNGDLMWVKQLTGTNNERVVDIVLAGNGDAYVTGYVSSTDVTLGSLSIVSSSLDGFVARINSDGSPVWIKTFASNQTDLANSVALDPAGNVLVTGSIGDDLTVGTTALNVSGSTDVIVVKYNKDNGEPIWAKAFGGPDADSGSAITTHNDAIYVGGGFFQQFEGPGISTALVTEGELDGFILQLDGDGSVQWVKHLGGPNWDNVLALAIDNNGDCIAGGYFTYSLSVGANLSGRGNEDMFLIKLDEANGNLLWAKGAGSNAYDRVTSIAIDTGNNIYTTGTIEGVTLFDDITAGPTVLNIQVFAAKYSNTGDILFVYNVGGSESDFANDITVDSDNVVYVTGSYRQFSVTFGATEVQNAGADDMFLWRVWQ